MNVSPMILIFLCPLLFLAGFIDSIAGGGGLVSLNAYNAAGITGQLSLGTNKFSSTIGSTIACFNYIKTKNYHLLSVLPALVGAFAGSSIGSRLTLLLDKGVFSIIMLCITPVVAVITFIKKDYSACTSQVLPTPKYMIFGFLIGFVCGMYDGFYGPGTGLFLQLGFIMILKLEPKIAAGNARIVNVTSNIAALITFIVTGNVVYKIAIPCAVCSVLGNFVGSRLAIKKDVKIIRPIMLVVVSLLFVKILLDILGVKFF